MVTGEGFPGSTEDRCRLPAYKPAYLGPCHLSAFSKVSLLIVDSGERNVGDLVDLDVHLMDARDMAINRNDDGAGMTRCRCQLSASTSMYLDPTPILRIAGSVGKPAVLRTSQQINKQTPLRPREAALKQGREEQGQARLVRLQSRPPPLTYPVISAPEPSGHAWGGVEAILRAFLHIGGGDPEDFQDSSVKDVRANPRGFDCLTSPYRGKCLYDYERKNLEEVEPRSLGWGWLTAVDRWSWSWSQRWSHVDLRMMVVTLTRKAIRATPQPLSFSSSFLLFCIFWVFFVDISRRGMSISSGGIPRDKSGRMGVFTPRPLSHNGKAGATMHLDERKVQVQPGSKSKAWYFDHVLPVVRTLENIRVLPLYYQHTHNFTTPTTLIISQYKTAIHTTTTPTDLVLRCYTTNNNTCSNFKPQLCSVPSHPIPSCSSQPNGTMHARVCLGPPPITDAAPSSPSMLPLLLAAPHAGADALPLQDPDQPPLSLSLSSDERSMSSAAQRPPFPSLFHHPLPPTTIPLSLPTSTYPIIYFFFTHHNLSPIITLLHFPSLSSSQHIPSDLSAVPVSSSSILLAHPADDTSADNLRLDHHRTATPHIAVHSSLNSSVLLGIRITTPAAHFGAARLRCCWRTCLGSRFPCLAKASPLSPQLLVSTFLLCTARNREPWSKAALSLSISPSPSPSFYGSAVIQPGSVTPLACLCDIASHHSPPVSTVLQQLLSLRPPYEFSSPDRPILPSLMDEQVRYHPNFDIANTLSPAA
ncbi:uncharacterized protein CLUP02_16563 [Colletotrichum lupini]|uniref:Uncharacterized protein n=1 Tax=Colletotrichum lupini TaxID=145971 RepID=A0A9Q8T905_9PEZI|nr:uncharacterized protein CLUP02_16563 [Colletotrichum lupini]UQC91030.1 hypothetical protein CLUP02_16563 [Colletotrichum lupini]